MDEPIAKAIAALERRTSSIRLDAIGAEATNHELDALAARARAVAGRLPHGAAAQLALAIARGLELLRDGELPADDALTLLASGAHALATSDHGGALAAARYEIETLFPLPGGPRTSPKAPDVPLTALRRKPDAE